MLAMHQNMRTSKLYNNPAKEGSTIHILQIKNRIIEQSLALIRGKAGIQTQAYLLTLRAWFLTTHSTLQHFWISQSCDLQLLFPELGKIFLLDALETASLPGDVVKTLLLYSKLSCQQGSLAI